MAEKNRPLLIFRYLWENTDEEHPAIIKDILKHLESKGIHSNRKTVATDLTELQKSGFDIICNKSRQNQYFVGYRGLELAELKTIVDAIQAAKFISTAKSRSLIERLTSLGSPHQADQLKRNLYVDGKIKTNNESVYYTVDLLHHAIQNQKVVIFQYIEYTPKKKKVLKHNGQKYHFSPYDLVWNNDAYYVFGWSENHSKVVKFRVDRMNHPYETELAFYNKPQQYSIEMFCKQVFSMYDGEECMVTLRCDNSVRKDLIDRFGEDVETTVRDDNSFLAEVAVAV
ncbi:MAG: WYL domain-containing protein, partial [Oscillospiraceae bacterium]|nr:WYL domain-containing protein [Oscillospiraceae bacterium]